MTESFNPDGRPTLYNSEYHDDHVFRLCLLGMNDVEISSFFGISEQTLNTWKKKHPSFLESLRNGKEDADAKVAAALYKRATGYKVMKTKFATHEGAITDEKEYEEEVVADVGAAKLWLKNRQPDKWREKIEVEQTVDDRRRDIDSFVDAEDAARAYAEEMKHS